MKKDGKRLAAVGVLIGVLAAAFKTTQLVSEDIHQKSPNGPIEFSWRDWKRALIETKNALANKNLSMLAAGVAYYSTLAFFPLLAAAVAIAALLISPQQIQELTSAAQAYLPGDVANLVSDQLEALVGQRAGNLLAAVVAIGVALFGASGASKNLVVASNVAYGVKESRSWLAQQARGIGWTIGGIGFGFLVVVLLAFNQGMLESFGVPGVAAALLLYGRWPLIIVLTMLGLAVFYRYGPNRKEPKWQWVSWGAIIATVVWLVVTALFFIYVQSFGSYSKTYSLFAGIIILMVWLNLSALVVLIGAEINHRLERVGRDRHATLSE